MGPLWGSVTGHFAAHRRAWALLLLAVACLSARADERPPDLVTVGVLRDWPPEYSLDSQGRPQGFAIDVMNEVARRAGLTVRTVQFETFPEMERALATGEIDVIPNFGIVEGRLPEAAFTRPVETFSVGLFVRQQTRGIESISDLPGQKVAAVAGNVGIRLLADRGVQPVVYPTVTSALFDLLAGQVDAVVYPSSVMWARAREAGVADHLREVGPPLAEIKRAIAARASDQALVERLRKAVDGLVGTPDFQRIYVRWYGTAPPFWTVRRVLVAAGVVLAGLLLAVVAWRFRVLARHNRELRRHIAERERAQVALAASEEKYRQIVETSGEGVWVADAAGVTSFVNRRMAEMLGRTPDQMVGRPVTDFVDPELAGEATRYLQRRREGRAEVHDFTLRHVDGRELSVLMAASPIVENGEYRGALAMVTDLTERRQLEAELRRSQRLEALGRLTGGIAHDFNNLLFVISAALELAKKRLGAGGAVLGELDDIEAAAERARALTAQLLVFARRRPASPKVLRPAEAIAAAAPLLRHLLGSRIELSLDLAATSGAVKIDPVQLEQLLFNLASNARDAMPNGGRLRVAVEDTSLEGAAGSPASDCVRLTVQDTGTGIPAEALPHVFDPFFTTKPEGRGTGLGLATCHGIVAQAGGRITVASKPNEGACFTLFFPRVALEERPERASAAAAPAPAGALEILLVEDEPEVRRMVELTLAREGHVVHPVGAPGEALQVCQAKAASLDVLLTDFRMPEMNGQQLARACRELAPGLGVVYMSGDVGQAAEDVTLGDGDSVLAKPFTSAQLCRAIGVAAERRRRRREV